MSYNSHFTLWIVVMMLLSILFLWQKLFSSLSPWPVNPYFEELVSYLYRFSLPCSIHVENRELIATCTCESPLVLFILFSQFQLERRPLAMLSFRCDEFAYFRPLDAAITRIGSKQLKRMARIIIFPKCTSTGSWARICPKTVSETIRVNVGITNKATVPFLNDFFLSARICSSLKPSSTSMAPTLWSFVNAPKTARSSGGLGAEFL